MSSSLFPGQELSLSLYLALFWFCALLDKLLMMIWWYRLLHPWKESLKDKRWVLSLSSSLVAMIQVTGRLLSVGQEINREHPALIHISWLDDIVCRICFFFLGIAGWRKDEAGNSPSDLSVVHKMIISMVISIIYQYMDIMISHQLPWIFTDQRRQESQRIVNEVAK